ncbi:MULTISPECIES: C40 family peptidase [Paenibacillus]|uniref:C40 family peptidase n=1 Tax=Paenibacillus TaxID=44249 RepID=UPI0022B898C1|nr:SH3 domain-containing C40 family peptidase [Paenibacillus caseinilyticus]MCZ8520759.1 SH3 domain-containing C40 family peptidase [Paenibacillus caseinilyticus]
MKKHILTVVSAALIAGTFALPQGQAHAATTSTVVNDVSFRKAPDTDAARIRYLQEDEKITIVSKVNDYWYKVTDKNGVTGYVSSSSKYITAPKTTSTASGSTGKIVSGVSFRKAADTDSARIRYLQAGETVTVLDKTNSYWYKVKDKNGVTGYISTSSKYISTSYKEPAASTSSTSTASKPAASTGSTTTSQKIEKVIAAGNKYLGTPYEFASDRSTTSTFDCSDFVRQAFKDALGVTLPSNSRTQADYVREHSSRIVTNIKDLKRGDLVFFMSYKGTSLSSYAGIDKSEQRITHVGIYLGDGKMLNTWGTGGVKVDTITGRHWEGRFIFGGSAL